MTSSRDEIKRALLESINESAELRELIEGVPDKVAQTVAAGVPVDTGTAKASIEVKARRTAYKRLSTRRVRVGTVQSDDDPQKIATLEYGRDATDDNGPTPEYAMWRKAAAYWNALDL